jgi:hypothetical protein
MRGSMWLLFFYTSFPAFYREDSTNEIIWC